MRINRIDTTTTNKNTVNFNGFVDKSLIESIQRHSLQNVKRELSRWPRTRINIFSEEKDFAESTIQKLKDAMAKMHPATGLYKEEPNQYLVLKNSITGKTLDLVRMSDYDLDKFYPEYNIRYDALPRGRYLESKCPYTFLDCHFCVGKIRWTGRSLNQTISRNDYKDVANHIKENFSTYDNRLKVDNITEPELQVFLEKQKAAENISLKNKNKNKIMNFIDKFCTKMKIYFITKYCNIFYDDIYISSLKEKLKTYYAMFPDLKR